MPARSGRLACQLCAAKIAAGQTVCASCRRTPPPLDRCVAALEYDYPWDQLISRFKFNGEAGLADALAELMSAVPAVQDLLRRQDWLIPMPLSRRRLAVRGFNQAHELARRLGSAPSRADVVLRLRDTADQHTLTRAARLGNLRGAFVVDPRRAELVRGRHVALVDDVMTTGASLHELARVLRSAGAASVSAVVLARADARTIAIDAAAA